MADAPKRTFAGHCHCRAVKYEVELPAADASSMTMCDCTYCDLKGMKWLFVTAEDLKNVVGRDELTTYLWNKKTMHHQFCKHCGVQPWAKSFWQGKEMYGINAAALEGYDFANCATRHVKGSEL